MRPFQISRIFNLFCSPPSGEVKIPAPALALPLQGSLLPSTGTGTLTHTRTTSAWMWRDSDGRIWVDYAAGRVLIECPAGELRFAGARRISAGVYSNTLADGTPIPANEIAAVVEPLATNLKTYSQAITSGLNGYQGSLVATINAATAPDGTQTASVVTYKNWIWVAFPGSPGPVTFSIWMKSATGTSFTTSISVSGYIDGVRVATKSVLVTDVWNRFFVSGTTVTSGGFCRAIVSDNPTGTNPPVGTQLWGWMVEPGLSLSSYIPTAGSTVTRNADVLTLTDYTIPNAAGTAYFEASATDWAQVGGQLFGGGTEYLLAPITTQSGIRAFDGTNTANGPTGTPSGMMRFAVRWNATTGKMRLAANGVLGDEANYDGNWNLGSQLLASGFAGLVRNFRTYSTALSDAQMKRLTK